MCAPKMHAPELEDVALIAHITGLVFERAGNRAVRSITEVPLADAEHHIGRARSMYSGTRIPPAVIEVGAWWTFPDKTEYGSYRPSHQPGGRASHEKACR